MLNVNRVAFATVCGFAALTGLAGFTALTTTSTVVAVASKFFALLAATGCCAAIYSWEETRADVAVSQYFVNFREICEQVGGTTIAIPAIIVLSAWTCCGRLVEEVRAFSRPARPAATTAASNSRTADGSRRLGSS